VLNVLSFPDFNLVFMRNVIYYIEKAGMSVTHVTNRGNVMYIFWLENTSWRDCTGNKGVNEMIILKYNFEKRW
jgi:hypothetical protein